MEHTEKNVPENGMEQNEVQEEKQEVSSENLFDLVDSGKLTLEEANEFSANESAGVPQSGSFAGKRKNNGADTFFPAWKTEKAEFILTRMCPKTEKTNFWKKKMRKR